MILLHNIKYYGTHFTLELSTWRAVRVHLIVFGFLWFLFLVVFSCSVLKEVEGCNWALCRTPNCLTVSKNYVEFQSFGGKLQIYSSDLVLKEDSYSSVYFEFATTFRRPNL